MVNKFLFYVTFVFATSSDTARASLVQPQDLDGTPPLQRERLIRIEERRHLVREPGRALLHRHVWVVDRVQDALEPNLLRVELHEVRREVARGCLEDIVLEVERHVLLHRHPGDDLAGEFCLDMILGKGLRGGYENDVTYGR